MSINQSFDLRIQLREMIPWNAFIFLSLVHADHETAQNSSVRSTDSTPTDATNTTVLPSEPCHLSGSAANYCECSKPGEHVEQDLLMIKCLIDQKYENETILDVFSDTWDHHQGQGLKI